MDYRFIEELSLNNWPSLSTFLYDSWVLRFADGYTKRANSINPIHPSTQDLSSKIKECESLYFSNRLPAIYKITPFVHPANLDHILADQGYSLVDHTSVRTLDLDQIREPDGNASVQIDERPTAEWLEAFCRINEIPDKYINVMKRMLGNIRTRTGFISLYYGEQAVACGLGVLERGYIGLYDIVTDASFRNRGFGEQMLLHLLRWGKDNGAAHSYLAVVLNNAPALRLYSKVGFSEVYTYWYRVKELPGTLD